MTERWWGTSEPGENIMLRDRAWATVIAAGLLACGCGGGPHGQVSGVVRSGGRPLGNVLVIYLPDPDAGARGGRAVGRTDEVGRYDLKGSGQKDGVPVGPYRVYFEDLAEYEAPRSADGTVLKRPPVRVPPRYLDPLQSPVRQEVRAGPQVVDLDVSQRP
jgi:hypothetical protein